MTTWQFEVNVSDDAAALVRRKGGVIALDFIPPIS
jgi:microsomal dipeptidase-like Zn-dependent dipeptidase